MTHIQTLDFTPTKATLPAGFTHRAGRWEDAQIVTDVLNAESMANVGRTQFSLEECESEWSSPDYNVETACQCVFAPDGRLAGFIEVWDTDETPVSIALFGATHPDFYGRGIATWLLEWAENRGRLAIDRCPPEARVAAEIYAKNRYQPRLDLAAGAGYKHERSYLRMVIEVDPNTPFGEPVWPDGITVKTLTEYGDGFAVMKALEVAFEDHYGFVPESDEQLRKDLEHKMSQSKERFDPDLWFVALEGDDIVGVATNTPMADENPAIGWVANLGVLPPARKQGLGLALLLHSFRALATRPQIKQIGLGVDAGSLTGATRLYEKAGMHVEYDIGIYTKVLRDGVRIERH